MTETEQKMLHDRKLKIDPEDSRFGDILRVAVRHAIEHSVWGNDVCNYATMLVPALCTQSLQAIAEDITKAVDNNAIPFSGERAMWMRLRADIWQELESRK